MIGLLGQNGCGKTTFMELLAVSCPPKAFSFLSASLTEEYSDFEDAFGKKFIRYHITVQHGDLEWEIKKRYSEFVTLDQELRNKRYTTDMTYIYIYI